MNTYELTEDKTAIVITDENGVKTLTTVSDLPNIKQGIINSKNLTVTTFDERIAEVDRQLAFVASQQ